MRVLLIQPPFEDFYITSIRTYPLGLLYIATALENLGHSVKILDALNPLQKKTVKMPKVFNYLKPVYNAREVGPIKLFGEYYRFGLSNQQILKEIGEYQPEVVGISSNFTAYFSSVSALAKDIKAKYPHIQICIGGYHATVFSELITRDYPEIDVVISGTAEKELSKFFASNHNPLQNNADMIVHHGLLSNKYLMHKQNMISLIASRGCPHNCAFCTVKTMHKTYSNRSVASVIKEMQVEYELNKVRVFNFEDDNISCNKAWFAELLQTIINAFEGKSLVLYAMNGIDIKNLEVEILSLMYRAGFRSLNISLVTAVDLVKAELGRPFKNVDFEKTVNEALRLGFAITTYIIIGLPSQTKQSILEGIEYLSRFDVLIAPSFYYPPPGTNACPEFDLSNPDNWPFVRSSVFPIEAENLKREDMVYLFSYIRLLNFAKFLQKKYALPTVTLEILNTLSTATMQSENISRLTEEEIGIAQLKEYLASNNIVRVYR